MTLFYRIHELCTSLPHKPLCRAFAVNDSMLGSKFPVGLLNNQALVFVDNEWINVVTGVPSQEPSVAFTNIYEAISAQALDLDDTHVYAKLMDRLSVLGSGLVFHANKSVDPSRLATSLEKFGCHPHVGIMIAHDLNAFGRRACTVKVHVGREWVRLGQHLKTLGVNVEPVAPRLGNASIPLDVQLKQLVGKFK